jgi:hypothetical protein
VPSNPIAPVVYGLSSGTAALPSSAFAMGAREIALVGQTRAPRERVGAVARDVALRGTLARHGVLLKIDGECDVSHAPPGERRPAGEVGDVLHVRWPHDASAVLRDVAEQVICLHVLLRMRRDQIVVGHPGDREHGRLIQLRVVEPVEQMHGAGARGREADAETAGELGIRTRHERRRFLVTHLDEPDAILPRTQRFHDAVDTVAGKPEDDVHAPVVDRVDEDVGRRLRHVRPPGPCAARSA